MKTRLIIFQKKWIYAIIAALILIAIPLATVKAAEFPDDEVIDADKVIDDDVFISGENVIIDGTINGNLFAAGSSVRINGTVSGDAILAGNSIEVSEDAQIGGNVFFGGATASIGGQIAGSVLGGSSSLILSTPASVDLNVYYGGFAMESQPGSSVQKDLFVAAYQAVLGGSVDRDANIGAAAVEINGSIGRNANLEVEGPGGFPYFGPTPPGAPAMIEPGLRISDGAQIGGTVTYTSPVDQTGAIEAEPEGGIVYQTPVPEATPAPEAEVEPEEGPSPVLEILKEIAEWFFKLVRNFITLIILGGLAIWLIPTTMQKTADQIKDKPLPSAGYGFLFLIGGYIIAFTLGVIILMVGIFFSIVTLGGLSRTIFGLGFSSLAVLFTVFLFLVSHGSKLVVAFLGGQWIMQQLAPKSTEQSQRIIGLLVGIIIYVLLRAIPILGWLTGLLVTIIGLGAIWLVFFDWYKSRRGRSGKEPAETSS